MAALIFAMVVGLARGLSVSETLWSGSRGELLNLLNHPLQIQLATGELPYGSFLRLTEDRSCILEGLVAAAGDSCVGSGLVAEVEANGALRDEWRGVAEARGKTIAAGDGVDCYGCGGNHLNVDCPDELGVSQSARALAAVVRSGGDGPSTLAAVAAVCRGYGWACGTVLDAALGESTAYDGWLVRHARVFQDVGAEASAALDASGAACDDVRPAYVAALSALYNYVDSEASTAGLKGSGAALDAARRKLGDLEPGFLEAQDRNANFVADLKEELVRGGDTRADAAAAKMDAAAAYLAKKRGGASDAASAKMDAAAAYLAKKRASS